MNNEPSKAAIEKNDAIYCDSIQVADAAKLIFNNRDTADEIGSLIIKIEKFKGVDTHSMLKLADLIINKTSDSVWRAAESYTADNAGDE